MQAAAAASAHRALDQLIVALAIILPFVWSGSVVPDTVFVQQVLAVLGWGLWLLLKPPAIVSSARSTARSGSMAAAVAAIVLTAVLAAMNQPLAAGVLLAAVAVLAVAAQDPRTSATLSAEAWWCVGLLCAPIAVVQYFDLPVSDLLVVGTTAGRAVGNLRQPNHLATALVCSMVMTIWLWQARRLGAHGALASLAAMVVALTLSASRTGALSLGLLAVWGLVDRRLPRAARWALVLGPLLYAACWLTVTAYADWQHTSFYGSARLHADGDVSSSRFAIWRDTLVLIANDPWSGVGWGNFNLAWTFTPLPERPVAFFDHTHNLLLQLVVEIGLPATALVLALLALALWRTRHALRDVQDGADHPARAVLVLLLVLGVHSLLEYPLWYAYFLLPAAAALGILIGCGDRPDTSAPARPGRPRAAALARVVGALMVLGAAFAALDHRRVEAIFVPPPGAGSLPTRIADGRKSRLFGHHADYAAVTNPPRDQALASFRRPLHQLVDVRLLIAYIEALQTAGQTDRAIYAAQRLREFRRDDAQAYFSACTPENAAPPLQCSTRPVPLGWRDLEP